MSVKNWLMLILHRGKNKPLKYIRRDIFRYCR